MRPATKEERESVDRYIKSISHKTGITFMTDTYNTSGVPVDYQDRMAKRMTETIKSKSFVHVDDALKIIDSHKYSICWSETEKLWNDRMDEIKAAVLALKGCNDGV